jgi:MarR family transcriptional regulator, organic hydroperoxide resistance regulator
VTRPASPTSRRLPLYESPEDLRLGTWVQWVRTFYRLQRRVTDALTRHEITLPQFDVLATLRFSEGVTQQELAERLLVTKGNVCGVLDRLEKLGWVKRSPDLTDGRVNRVSLTPDGRRKVELVMPDHNETVLQVLRALPSDEQVRSLRRMLVALDQENPG